MSDQHRPPLARDAVETQREREAREARHQVLIELLAAYADRELPAETTSQIDAHLVGCGRCRSELAVHQAVRARLGVEPPVAAPPALRERIAAAIAAAPVPVAVATHDSIRSRAAALWARHRVLLSVAVVALVVTVTAAGAGLARRVSSGDAAASAAHVSRLAVPPASVPLLADVLADYRRVTAGDLPGRARDLDVVQGAAGFPVEPLRASGVRLLAAWTTDLGGEPAVVLAYRWDDRILLEYLVPEGRFFRHPAVRAAVTGGRPLVAASGAQGLVAWPTRGAAGAVLVGDVAPERLAKLAAGELLAKAARDGAE